MESPTLIYYIHEEQDIYIFMNIINDSKHVRVLQRNLICSEL